ncbi:MAG: hypothetical protein ACFCVH_07510 [Alphaproteobacteria bacterium]
MFEIASKLAAALVVSAALVSPAVASIDTILEPAVVATPADQGIDLAYYCEYIIVWDAWGNAYYEYLCY